MEWTSLDGRRDEAGIQEQRELPKKHCVTPDQVLGRRPLHTTVRQVLVVCSLTLPIVCSVRNCPPTCAVTQRTGTAKPGRMTRVQAHSPEKIDVKQQGSLNPSHRMGSFKDSFGIVLNFRPLKANEFGPHDESIVNDQGQLASYLLGPFLSKLVVVNRFCCCCEGQPSHSTVEILAYGSRGVVFGFQPKETEGVNAEAVDSASSRGSRLIPLNDVANSRFTRRQNGPDEFTKNCPPPPPIYQDDDARMSSSL